MGWKNLKEHFNIRHIVQVSDKGIYIGSGYVSDLVTIDATTGKIRSNPTFSNFLKEAYPALLEVAPERILQLIRSNDTFSASIPVYTYMGAEIIEKQCEAIGWPNVTHDGVLMYENRFSTDKATVVAWAKRNADLGISYVESQIHDAEKQLVKCRNQLEIEKANRAKLENEYPAESHN